jgi:hypothetical protein
VRRSTYIVMAVVFALFVISWIVKALAYQGEVDHNIVHGFLVTFSAFLTLAVLSFLYKDNPFYKFAEHLFVGVSAAFWMSLGFWRTLVGNLIPRISEPLSRFFEVESRPAEYNFVFYIPIILGILLLMRLLPKGGWISRWPLAWIVGTTAGLNFVRYLRSDFIKQVSSTFVPLLGQDWQGLGHFLSSLSLSATGPLVLIAGNWVIFLGTLSGLVYFYFSKEHKGVFGAASRVGIWVLMVTFGASFGYTVMGRISLLVGRITFLFRDWLELIS